MSKCQYSMLVVVFVSIATLAQGCGKSYFTPSGLNGSVSASMAPPSSTLTTMSELGALGSTGQTGTTTGSSQEGGSTTGTTTGSNTTGEGTKPGTTASTGSSTSSGTTPSSNTTTYPPSSSSNTTSNGNSNGNCTHDTAPTSSDTTASTDSDSNTTSTTDVVECDLGSPSNKVILSQGFAESHSNASATRVCMSTNACLNLINAYASARGCTLAMGNATTPGTAGSCAMVFPGSNGTCNNAQVVSDATVQSMLSAMAAK